MADISQIVTIKKQYMCCACESVHDKQWKAEECCEPDVEEVYVCPICDEAYSIEKTAIDCCGFDSETNPAPISAEELEAHGQLRLEAVA